LLRSAKTCTLLRGVGKEQEEQKWIDLNWGNARDGVPGIHYMLNPSLLPGDATIIEVGGWEGRDIQLFMEKNPSKDVRIHSYEPMRHKHEILSSNVQKFGRGQVETYSYGLGNSNRTSCFKESGGTRDEGTSEIALELCNDAQVGSIRDVSFVLAQLKKIDLLHVNCEGCEYEILKRIFQPRSVLSKKIRVIEVQFHEIISENKYCEIEKLLRGAGFTLEYRFQFVWEAWVRLS